MTNLSDLEAKADAQTTGLIVDLAAGLPLLATGIILFVAGKQRKDAVSRVALSPAGVEVRF